MHAHIEHSCLELAPVGNNLPQLRVWRSLLMFVCDLAGHDGGQGGSGGGQGGSGGGSFNNGWGQNGGKTTAPTPTPSGSGGWSKTTSPSPTPTSSWSGAPGTGRRRGGSDRDDSGRGGRGFSGSRRRLHNQAPASPAERPWRANVSVGGVGGERELQAEALLEQSVSENLALHRKDVGAFRRRRR